MGREWTALTMKRLRRVSTTGMLLAMLAAVSVTTSCDNSPTELANGWVTNCSGAEFSQFSQSGGSGLGPDRPVFKINDQLVIAVPKINSPSANGIDSAPRACRKRSDLPPVNFLVFTNPGDLVCRA
jgi:hypothetical protein